MCVFLLVALHCGVIIINNDNYIVSQTRTSTGA